MSKQLYRKVILLQSNFIEIVLRHGCSPVLLFFLNIFRLKSYKKVIFGISTLELVKRQVVQYKKFQFWN